jgi:hypothetical protein
MNDSATLTVTTNATWSTPNPRYLTIDDGGGTQLTLTEHEARMLIKDLSETLNRLAPRDRPVTALWLSRALFTLAQNLVPAGAGGDDLSARIETLRPKNAGRGGTEYRRVNRDQAATLVEMFDLLLPKLRDKVVYAEQQVKANRRYAYGTPAAAERLRSAQAEERNVSEQREKLALFIEEERDTDERIVAGLTSRQQGA